MSELTKSKPVNIQSALVKAMQSADIDMDKFERFLDLQLKMEDRQAEMALSRALTEFQLECPIITKTKKGHNSSYAPFDEIVYQIKPLLKKCGLSYAFETKKINEKENEMTVIIRHIDGASFRSSYTYLSLDDGGKMNSSQKKRSANTYAKRTAFENALGIATQGTDDDAQRCADNLATDEQINEIESLIKKTKSDEKKMLTFLKAESLDMLSEYDAKRAITMLKQKIKK